MAHRGARMTEFEERDYYPPPRRSAPEFDDVEYRSSRVATRSPPPRARSRVATRDEEIDVRVRERETNRTPAFLREDARRTEAGPMVLRQRDVETVDRHHRSPSPVRYREERLVRRPKSASPPPMREEHEHLRFVERERVRSPSVVRRRSPSPLPVRFVERPRRSPSPVAREHIHTRIVERERERIPSPSPSPPPPPPVIRGPIVEREVITHYTDVDHGVVRAKRPSPPPAPRARPRERETDIDISLSKNRTEVDIHRSTSRARSRSHERRSHYHDDDLDVVVRRDDRLRIDDRSRGHRRARSAAPLGSPVDEEADYITGKMDARGRMGEARGGATKDWTIVDVPPGTERVRMDGIGGAGTDTTWSRYSGVRRTQFIPERDGAVVPRAPSPGPTRGRTSVAVDYHKTEIDVDIERRITKKPAPPPPAPPREMWTEITKDLVVREAIEQMGYEYEETKWFFYIMDYLRYDDVLQLTELSESIRRARKVREIKWERDFYDEWDHPYRRHHHDHHHGHHHDHRHRGWDDERVREREVIYDSRRPARLKEPWKKYKRFQPLNLPDRQWPNKTVDKAPRWLATDLRDGNQSLVDPMNGDEKWRYFKMLVDLGYKEIEVSFPSASDTDFDFTRRLIETPGTVPDDVWLQVLSPCREDLIKRTVQSLKGAKKALVHIYLATSECFRRVVFNHSKEDALATAVRCAKLVRALTKDDPSQSGTEWAFEFSPETFSDTEPEFVIEICEAVKAAWEPSVENPIIFNLPATVEMSTPNVYADQIEYFCRNVTEREKICVSLHPHNDRGCAVAAAELAQMAGADRVEGCLFGNGERTGNVDLVTLGLNLYTQGIHPNIDFSDLGSIIETVEMCNKIPVHERAPYGGSLVVCAFSGSHQDAIKKGFQIREKDNLAYDDRWQIPYLPLDPQDIGRTYEAVIRVNSQSGKGGAAWIILRQLQLDLPRGLQVAFSKVVQRKADNLGRELRPQEITELFEQTYFLNSNPRFSIIDYSIMPDRTTSPAPPAPGKTQDTKDLKRVFEGVIACDGKEYKLRGRGNGPISSLANALRSVGVNLDVQDYKEHAIGKGRDVKAATYIECTTAGSNTKVWGVGIHEDVVQSSLIALLSAASNFASSRPGSPFVPRPVSQGVDVVELELNGNADGPSSVVTALEAKASGM
ncbi:2-isopropylmalate synthase [Purpureocillium lavendulum]|uniref:2-isopropylmalate synthase n=1 Tax=Purpureocillium lavendulum TaxID=1247861 RepID=A0AB34G553_9HYPO|nr:2-isopropylmalate synthase [Purpureocillium lavendulum]